MGGSNTTKPDAITKKVTVKAATSYFGTKLSQMSEMFKNKGIKPGQHRPSMLVGMPENFKFGNSGPILGGPKRPGASCEIINEEPDKMKPGYDPAENLQKTLSAVVVVKKDKKKKKKPTTFNG